MEYPQDDIKHTTNTTTASLIYGAVGSVKRLSQLYVESLRLKATDKLTVLLSSIAYVGVMLALGIVCLVFISIGIGHLLSDSIEPHLAYLFIAGFYLLLFVLAILLRRRIFVDPISRFMSRLLVEIPEDEGEFDIVKAQEDDTESRQEDNIIEDDVSRFQGTADQEPLNNDSHE